MNDGNEGSSVPAPPPTVDLCRDASAVVDLTGKVHQLPCCIKYNGPTTVSHYFKPNPTGVQVDGLSMEEAYFRGRKLQGTTVALPRGYFGFILGKTSSDERTSDCWATNATFQSFKVWNHDAMPSKDDTFLRAFHWFTVADAFLFPIRAVVNNNRTLARAYCHCTRSFIKQSLLKIWTVEGQMKIWGSSIYNFPSRS